MADDLRPEDVPDDLLQLYGRNYNGTSVQQAERSALAAVLTVVRRQHAEEQERLRAAYDIVRGQLSGTRKEYSDLMGDMLEWRRRAHKAERSVRALIADPPPVPDGTDDDQARRGYAERTIDQWRKYGAHWRERAEAAEQRLSLARDALLDDGYFTPEQVDRDVAPRIVERLSALRHELEQWHAAYGEKALPGTLRRLHAAGAAAARVRREHAAIHAEMDAFALKHEPHCECEVIPATRQTADRMLAALDAPQESG